MTSSTLSCSNDTLHRVVYELLTALHTPRRFSSDTSPNDAFRLLVVQLLQICERRIEDLHDVGDDEFEEEWALLVWTVLDVLGRLCVAETADAAVLPNLNHLLISLVNKAKPIRQPRLTPEAEPFWPTFYSFYNQTLHATHGLCSQLSNPTPSMGPNLDAFCEQQLQPLLNTFRDMSRAHSEAMHTRLRVSQVQRISQNEKMCPKELYEVSQYYTSMLYILGLLAARIQGYRYMCASSPGFFFAQPTTLLHMHDVMANAYEQLLHDALFCTEPSTSPILVTNNLFAFNCEALCRSLFFKGFDVQIVSEDTAGLIQKEMQKVRSGVKSANQSATFPSAALLAMKPTSGVKRNNATANASGEGGNTAHKKSDVNSKESVVLTPTYNDKLDVWQAAYPHLLCTTRQKATRGLQDAVLLENRPGQMGKRPLFYFSIRGTAYSPNGTTFFVRTLSPPFTIATRRNQDCQVQRMMSSYTATCFWLYGICSVNGIIMNWEDAALPWTRFKELCHQYFTVSAEVKRPLQDCDFTVLEDKLECDECRDYNQPAPVGKTISFKNALCPHLRFDTEHTSMRFSIWRGILEILQLFQEQKSNVRTLWDEYILHGFLDTPTLMSLLQPYTSIICARLTYILGGSICVTVRNRGGETVHLEPIDVRKLQTRSIFEYLADVAESAKIDHILTARHELLSVGEFIAKYKIRTEASGVHKVTTNASHAGPLEELYTINCVPLRVAVVTCDHARDQPTPSPSSADLFDSANQHTMPLISTTNEGASFATQLEALMKTYNKTPAEVCQLFSYGNNLNMDPFHPIDASGQQFIGHDNFEFC